MRRQMYWGALLWLALLVAPQLQAQTLTQVRIFFDDNATGYQYFTVNNLASLDQSFQVNVAALTKGVHTMYVQVKDNQGRWSFYDQTNVQVLANATVATLGAAEYFFDVDPGLGAGTQIALSGTSFDGDLELDLSGLAVGVHTLYVRVKDDRGNWSLYDQANFTVTNPQPSEALVEAEYYFDADPGIGNGFPLLIPASQIVDGNFELNIPSNLSNGAHNVCIRVKNSEGFWSETSCRPFNVCQVALPVLAQTGNACQDGFVTLSVINNVYSSYSWSNGQQTSSIQVSQSGVYEVQVQSNGCSATANIEAELQTVEAPQFNITGNPCPGGVQTVQVLNVYDTYQWSTGSANSAIQVNAPGSYSVSVSRDGCARTASIEVDFINPVAPTIQVVGEACVGNSVNLSVPLNTPGIQWSTGATSAVIFVTTSGDYAVQSVNQGCPVNSTVSVQFGVPPSVELTVEGTLCAGSSVSLNATAGYDSYAWSNGSVTATTSVNTSGNYSVQVFDGDCSVTESIQVLFIELPTPSITTNVNVLACSISNVSYQWFLNGNAIAGANAQFYTAMQSGFYTVQISDDGCSANSEVLNFTYIGVEEWASVSLRLWPNPTRDVVSFSHTASVATIEVVNVCGQTVARYAPNAASGAVDIEHLSAGTYVLKATTVQGVTEVGFIVKQ